MGGPATVSTSAPADAVYRKIAWRIVPFLMLCYLLASLDRSNVAFAKLQFMPALGFDDIIYGLGAGLFSLGYILFEVPSNMWLQRIGVRATLLRIMFVWGLCCALLAFMVLPWHYYLLRFLLGVAEAGFFPGVIYYLTRWTPAARRARLIALFMASIAVSGILGGPISAAIMENMAGVLGLAGWQWVFILEGLPTCAVGVAAYFYLSETPAAALWLTPAEKAIVAADLEVERPLAPGSKTLAGVPSALRTPRFAALAVASFALMTGTGGLFLWLPSILRNSGVTDIWSIGLYSAVPFAIGAVVQFLFARNSDRTGERRLHVSGAFLIGALGWAAAAQLHDQPAPALAAMTFAVAGTLAAMGPFWTLPPRLFGGGATAVGIAIVTTIGGVGNFVSPPIVGVISTQTGSLVAAQYYFASLMLLSALAIFLVWRSEPSGSAQRDQAPAPPSHA